MYTQVIPDANRKTLMPIPEEMIVPDSIVCSDAFPSYNFLKECEWRFNAQSSQAMLREFKRWLKEEKTLQIFCASSEKKEYNT